MDVYLKLHGISRRVRYNTRGRRKKVQAALKFLNDMGWSIDTKVIEGWPAPLSQRSSMHLLGLPCSLEEDADLVQLILDCGADVNQPCGPEKQTPLHMAASWGNRTLVDLLLDRGACMDKVDRQGRFPLHVALEALFLHVALSWEVCPKFGNVVHRLLHVGASVADPRPLGYHAMLIFCLHNVHRVSFPYTLDKLDKLYDAILQAGLIPGQMDEEDKFDLRVQSQGFRDLVPKLTMAGFDLHSDSFVIEYEAESWNCFNILHKQTVTFLKNERAAPPPLLRLCRTAVRTSLILSRPAGVHLDQRVDCLPLSRHVKDFLKLRDLPKIVRSSGRVVPP